MILPLVCFYSFHCLIAALSSIATNRSAHPSYRQLEGIGNIFNLCCRPATISCRQHRGTWRLCWRGNARWWSGSKRAAGSFVSSLLACNLSMRRHKPCMHCLQLCEKNLLWQLQHQTARWRCAGTPQAWKLIESSQIFRI